MNTHKEVEPECLGKLKKQPKSYLDEFYIKDHREDKKSYFTLVLPPKQLLLHKVTLSPLFLDIASLE